MADKGKLVQKYEVDKTEIDDSDSGSDEEMENSAVHQIDPTAKEKMLDLIKKERCANIGGKDQLRDTEKTSLLLCHRLKPHFNSIFST